MTEEQVSSCETPRILSIASRGGIVLGSLLLLLASCSHAPPTLAEREDDLRGTDQSSACDQKLDPIRHEILDALEARSEAIRTFPDRLAQSDTAPPSRLRHIGPATFREYVDPLPAKDEWREKRYGWSRLHELFLRIKDQPVNAEWARLNRAARATLADDGLRQERHADYSLDEHSLQTLVTAIADLRRCYNETTPDCAALAIGSPTASWLSARPATREEFAQWRANPSDERARLHQLILSLDGTLLGRYQLRKSRQVSREGNTLVLSVDPGPFEGHEKELSEIIERYWKGPTLSLHIEWTHNAVGAGVRIQYSTQEPGERPHTQIESRGYADIVLADESLSAIGHEFGHALGFPDHYYTRWDDLACEYVTHANDADLMSNARAPGAAVTPDEFSALERVYR